MYLGEYISKDLIKTDVNIDILLYKNVRLVTSASSQKIKLEGTWFIIDATDQCYYHFVFDNVGQYLALKRVVPELKLAVRVPIGIDYKKVDYVKWCLDKLSSSVELYFCLESLGALEIDTLIAASTRLIPLFRLLDKDVFDLITTDNYQDFVVPALRQFFLDNLPKLDGPTKIYADRKSKSAEIQLSKDYVDFLITNGVSWNWDTREISDPGQVMSNLPDVFNTWEISRHAPWVHELEANTRYMSEEDENLIRNFFSDNGYYIMSHLNFDFETQMSLIMNCSEYATITGSSVLNSVVCKSDCKIYVINNNTNWPMPNHDYTPTIISNSAYSVFSMRENPRSEFTADQILNRLKELIT